MQKHRVNWIAGNSLHTRIRSMIIGLLGLATAAGLGLVAIASNQGWPENITHAIIPRQEHHVGPAEVVSRTPLAEGAEHAAAARPGTAIADEGGSTGADGAGGVSQPGGGLTVDEAPVPSQPSPSQPAGPGQKAPQPQPKTPAPSTQAPSQPAPAPQAPPATSEPPVAETPPVSPPGNSGNSNGNGKAKGHEKQAAAASVPPPPAPAPTPVTSSPEPSPVPGNGKAKGHFK